uniref:Uncharacterized protein n=1 Tax=Anopheles atroparvus TaxID=41427 RepID=A0A182ITQ8_ANOAO
MRSLLTPLHLPDGGGAGGGPLFHQVPIEGGTPDRTELSEAECDIDTIKKLKLGMRSSLCIMIGNVGSNRSSRQQATHNAQANQKSPRRSVILVLEVTQEAGKERQVPIEGGTPDRTELSEAECDIDTIKKLKLGMRSSLCIMIGNVGSNRSSRQQATHNAQANQKSPRRSVILVLEVTQEAGKERERMNGKQKGSVIRKELNGH